MLWLKRGLSGCIIFPVIFLILWIGMLAVGGGVSGFMAGFNNPDDASELGRLAGEEFGEKYSIILLVVSLPLAFAGTIGICWLLPWCKRKPEDQQIE